MILLSWTFGGSHVPLGKIFDTDRLFLLYYFWVMDRNKSYMNMDWVIWTPIDDNWRGRGERFLLYTLKRLIIEEVSKCPEGCMICPMWDFFCIMQQWQKKCNWCLYSAVLCLVILWSFETRSSLVLLCENRQIPSPFSPDETLRTSGRKWL